MVTSFTHVTLLGIIVGVININILVELTCSF